MASPCFLTKLGAERVKGNVTVGPCWTTLGRTYDGITVGYSINILAGVCIRSASYRGRNQIRSSIFFKQINTVYLKF